MCNCYQPPAEQCSPNPPPQPAYNIPYTAGNSVYVNNWISSQSNPAYPFSTNPNWPLNPGSNGSQITNNNQAKQIFTSVNSQQANGLLKGTGMPIFRTDQERMLYIQAQYSQAVYLPKKCINGLFN